MNKKTIITMMLALVAMAGQAQKHLPAFQYSKEPAVLSGQIIGNNQQITESVHVRYVLKYTSGTGDALRQASAAVDADGRFSLNLPTGTTVDCHVAVGECRFICYIVPGQTVTFTLDLNKLKTQGLANALMFGGQLADFNHDLVYATEQGIDPEAVNRYECGAMMPFCGQSIQYAGIDTDEAYDAFEARLKQRLEVYMKDDPWANPVLCYVMWSMPDTFVDSYVSQPVKLPAEYQQCRLASKFLEQMGAQRFLLTEAQKDSVLTFLPELAQDVLDYNKQMERELSFVSEQGMSRVCTLSDNADDILATILKPYNGKPVLLDLWETTCGPCRLAFKDMHDKKKELADRIHFVNIASENSDLSTWQRLIPNYIGDHYRLTKQQLQSLHSQLPCNTSGVPIWVLINADGTIHHAFTGWRNVDDMMKEINQVLQ